MTIALISLATSSNRSTGPLQDGRRPPCRSRMRWRLCWVRKKLLAALDHVADPPVLRCGLSPRFNAIEGRFDIPLASEPNNPNSLGRSPRPLETMISPMSCMGRSNALSSNKRDDFSGLVQSGRWQSSIDVMRSLISPRSRGCDETFVSARSGTLTGQLVGFGLALGYFLAGIVPHLCFPVSSARRSGQAPATVHLRRGE